MNIVYYIVILVLLLLHFRLKQIYKNTKLGVITSEYKFKTSFIGKWLSIMYFWTQILK